MRSLSPEDLLQVWERGTEQGVLDRTLLLLRCARDEQDAQDPAELPLGARDAKLLDLRERTFGPEMTAVAVCPQCKTQIELRLHTANLRLPDREVPANMSLSVHDYSIEFRLPRGSDFLAPRDSWEEPSGIQSWLLSRCVLNAKHSGSPVEINEIPAEVLKRVEKAMAEADPQAETELSMKCGQCHFEWQELFYIDSFFWTEIQAWVAKTLRDVHQLAAAYGWSEREILRLPPRRRNAYLDLIEE